jgi:hypothetical protein
MSDAAIALRCNYRGCTADRHELVRAQRGLLESIRSNGSIGVLIVANPPPQDGRRTVIGGGASRARVQALPLSVLSNFCANHFHYFIFDVMPGFCLSKETLRNFGLPSSRAQFC